MYGFIYQGVKNVDFILTNKLYVTKYSGIQPEFKKLTEIVFNSTISRLDNLNSDKAARGINDWVRSATKEKIENLIDAGRTRIQEILFRGVWFDDEMFAFE